ncbi:MAG: SPOR domain-containing protein [Thermodesulfovibrionales bacterium]
MRRVDLRGKPSAYVIGKGLIIAVILFTSSLGFILGYFVGRTTTKETQNIRLLRERSKDITKLPSEFSPLQREQSRTSIYTEKQDLQDTTSEITKETPTVNQKPIKQPKILYTIQVGAFKNPLDAENLKVKFDEKGFKTFVTGSINKNGEKLYRVWVGEFATRKEAEGASAKIKKTEGLQPFVTFKKGE